MPQQRPLAGARQLSYVYITAALKKRNGRFEIIIETPTPNRTKAVVAETCIVGHVRRFVAYGGHGIVWGTYWEDGDGLGGQEGRQ